MRRTVLSGVALVALCTAQAQGQADSMASHRMEPTAMGTGKSSSVTSPDPKSYGPEVMKAYEQVRHATAPFRDLKVAIASGYSASVPNCLSHPTAGAMGYHHINRANLVKEVEVEKPQILLFERRANGDYALNGVEYIVPYKLWPADSTPPRVMGRELVRADGLQLWYMHMWVWKRNKSGLFANFNPDAECRTPPAPVPTPGQ